MKKVIFGLGLLAMLSGCQKQAIQEKPNILVILADDAGYADFGFMGSKDIKSPHLDQLANNGVVFTDAHVSAAVCSPSRAGLLTGRYQQRFGHESNCPPKGYGMDTSQLTVANYLKKEEYKSIIIGKWHLGDDDKYHPNNRGFDEFYGFRGGSRSYWYNKNIDKQGNPHSIEHNKDRVDFDGYLTDVFGDKAVEYIDKYKKEPFFMYLSFNAPHGPMHAKEEHLKMFEGHDRKTYLSMVYSMDENIGKVIDKLKAEGIYENTIIFFLSDNGGAPHNDSSCYPLKGFKGNKFEGGHRIPFFVHWPKKLKGGRTYEGLTSSLDIASTALVAAGADISKLPLDGVNLFPFIEGKKESNPHEKLFFRRGQFAAMRHNDWKLIRVRDSLFRLYNLKDDLGEMVDLREKNPNKLTSMTKELEEWENDMLEPWWNEGKTWPEVTYEIHHAFMNNEEPTITLPAHLKNRKKK